MYSYIIYHNNANIDNLVQNITLLKKFICSSITSDFNETIKKILEKKIDIVFVIKNNNDKNISLKSISEAINYLDHIPYFIVISNTSDFALKAIQNGISDYLLDTNIHSLGQSLNRFTKQYKTIISDTICLKSYSDYNILKYNDILYLKADNNTTDFKLLNNKTITAYKTLKYFEDILPLQFLRIHKSYIININHLSRIHFSKKICITNFNDQLPFSNKYKENLLLHVY